MGVWIALDDSKQALGLRRSVIFWVQAFPIYLHYRLTEELVKGKSEEEEAAMYNALHDRYAARAVQLCMRLGGYFYKSAQIVSTRDEFVPPQYMVWLKQLQSNAPPQHSAAEVKAIIEEALGQRTASLFAEFDDAPCGAASVGQVHRARLEGGREVAVKVMYNNVEDMFRSDMGIIKSFCSLAMPHHLPALREIEKQFAAEFDYVREAANMEAIASSLNSHPSFRSRILVPSPVSHLCTRNVLVMDFVPGQQLTTTLKESLAALATSLHTSTAALEAAERDRIAKEGLQNLGAIKFKTKYRNALIRTADVVQNFVRFLFNYSAGWLVPSKPYQWSPLVPNLAEYLALLLEVHGFEIFDLGTFNADPHPGNILQLPDGRLGLIDYGCSIAMQVEDRCRLALLLLLLADGHDHAAAHCYAHVMGVRTRHMREDIMFKSAAFWYDRDTLDVTGGMNVHHFTEWLHHQDPIQYLPDQYVMAGRVSILLRGVGAAFGIKVKTAEMWRPHAAALLEREPAIAAKVREELRVAMEEKTLQ